MPYTEASPRSRKHYVILSVALVVSLAGCDKKGTEPDRPRDKSVAVSSFGDVPPPPPVVKVPDSSNWLAPDVAVFEDAGPVESEDVQSASDLQGVVAAQAAFVEAEKKRLDKVHDEVKEAERLIKAKVENGKRGFDSWRKRHGTKIPTMQKLEDLEQKIPKWKVKRAKSKQAVYPRFIEEDG